jgi:hypothetical protein
MKRISPVTGSRPVLTTKTHFYSLTIKNKKKMKISIDKELEKITQKKKEESNLDPVKEMKLLLESNSVEDARIIRLLSENSHFNRVEKVRGNQIALEKIEKDFDGKVYHINEIKKLCVDYRLRFLSSKYYTGSYDVEVASKIKEFSKNTNSPIDEYSLPRRYFIMAPASMFELRETKYISKAELRAQEDPAIFFKIDDNHYRLIHKWGNDFTVFRFIEAFRWRNWWSHQLFNTATIMPVVSFLYFLIFFSSPAAQFDNHPLFNGFTIMAISFLLAFIFCGIRTQDEGEPIAGFFNESNWDSNEKLKR